MQPPSRLYVRLTLALILPLLLAVAVGATLAIQLLEDTWTARVHDELATATALLAAGDLPYTPAMLDRFARLQRADFAVFDGSGRIGIATLAPIPPPLLVAVREFLAHPSPTRELRLEIAGTPHLVLMCPVALLAASRNGAVIAIASLADARNAAARAARLQAVAMLGASLLAAGLSYWLVRGVTRPIERVARMADRIALGERGLRLDLTRTDEVGALARAVDSMSSKLGAYESQLEARARVGARGELAARTAHELRNPLTAIKLHLQLLGEQLPPAQARRVERILSEVRRLELVADATLAVGQEQPLVTAPTDLDELVKDVVELMEPALAHRGIRIEARAGAPGERPVDPRKLKQVLLNLIVNAADALPEGGQIRVSAQNCGGGGGARLVVEDSGAGIAAERRERIFEGNASDKPFGFGLGLVLSRDIAQQHGGALRAESSAELGGARFVVELPGASVPVGTQTA